ncbi:cupin domain-containing protein [Fodinicola feengrottensis]|uniref:Cupin domain-containing protein n=1 Tax=Fodinicola feengrottensis TaxID=435914 RepID=A0ABN2H999_9ACTN|nr:cupin domain-containing protein [Fodinicola feengrottensis]
MTYNKESGEVSAIVRRNGEVETTRTKRSFARFVATGAETNGQFGLYEWNMQPRSGGSDPHFHRKFSESFFITAGTVEIYNGTEWVLSSPGDFVHVPAGGIHAFRNVSDEPASMMVIFAPGEAREEYFRELMDISNNERKLSEAEWATLYDKYDNTLA